MKQNKTFHLSIYTFMHFIVDLSCIFFLFGMIYVRLASQQQTLLAAVLYNLCAFGLPMGLGLAADAWGRNASVSCLGCFLIMLNYLLVPAPFVSVVIIGIGNGLFHIGGGRQILQDSVGNKHQGNSVQSEMVSDRIAGNLWYAPSGIFIASGALGVFLGRQMAAAFRRVFFVSMWAALVVCVVILAVCAVREWRGSRRSVLSRQQMGKKILLLSLLIFLVVIIRSYYGFAAHYTWNNGFLMGLIFTCCVVAGKFTGGILADWLGVFPASVISLGGAGILALFAADSPVIGCISILLFNMTMPITLTLLMEQWQELPGFAFGALMMALFLGTLPAMVLHIAWMQTPVGLFGLCMISLALLSGAILGRKRGMQSGG